MTALGSLAPSRRLCVCRSPRPIFPATSVPHPSAASLRTGQDHSLIADITKTELVRSAYDVWHDRAVFHFLTAPNDRLAYVRQAPRRSEAGRSRDRQHFQLCRLHCARFALEPVAFETQQTRRDVSKSANTGHQRSGKDNRISCTGCKRSFNMRSRFGQNIWASQYCEDYRSPRQGYLVFHHGAFFHREVLRRFRHSKGTNGGDVRETVIHSCLQFKLRSPFESNQNRRCTEPSANNNKF